MRSRSDGALTTARLVLRPTRADDAAEACRIQSNWNVARMLAAASYPPDAKATADWFQRHNEERSSGSAYRFAVTLDGKMIGLTDLDGIDGLTGELGYWLDEPYWGQGFAKEAARAVVRFGFANLGLHAIHAGHAADNPASGAVLRSLGFRELGSGRVHSNPRRDWAEYRRLVLERDQFRG